MGKKTVFQEDDQTIPPAKRQKFEDKPQSEPQPKILITSVADIKKLLIFHQDDVLQYRLSLQAFRKYLERLESKTAKQSLEDGILLKYLTTTTITTTGDQVEALPDIFQAWRYATQVYDEGLMVAIPGVLTVLLRTISSTTDFIEIGEKICSTIVRKENTPILQKSLNSSRVRDASIGRCLDLLTQVVSFDGGSCARNVWLQRNITMQRLPQFLEMLNKTIYGSEESFSVRDYAVTFFLTNLRYQNPEAKADILSTGKITQIMLRDIFPVRLKVPQVEKVSVIKEMLLCLRNYVLRDDELCKSYWSAKGFVLTHVNLGYVLRIMRHDDQSVEWKELRELAESFLTEACASHKHGIVKKQYGWYPQGTEDIAIKSEAQGFVEVILATEFEKYKESVPVRNTTLAQFLSDLRPWASVSERKLILRIFEAAPELVADYFLRKKVFSFEPKLTITWIGWATFLYSVLRLPCADHSVYVDGRIRAPPPTPIVIQSILPQSLTRQALMKALKHPSELIQLLTLRILVASFEKMQMVLNMFQQQANPIAWKATGDQILKGLAQKWPEYKQIFHLYQSYPKEKHILREISSSLLMLYNTVTPQLVSAEKMDISSHVTRMLNRVVSETETCDSSTFMELEHLLEISNCAMEAKWWQKHENTKVTSVTTILQLLTTSGLSQQTSLRTLVRNILETDYLLLPSETVDSLDALLMSLAEIKAYQQEIFQHLDECMLRFIRKPILYHGDIEDLVPGNKNDKITPLIMVLLEQWPFFLKGHKNDNLNSACAQWQSVLLAKAAEAGEPIPLLKAVCKRFQTVDSDKGIRQIFSDCQSTLEEIRSRGSINDAAGDALLNGLSGQSTAFEEQVDSMRALLEARLSISEESLNHLALTRWAKKDIPDAILDSDISNLIRYLVSDYPEVRIQAKSALRSFMSKVQASQHPDRRAIWILIGALLETLHEHKAETPIPSLAIALAARSAFVVIEPGHYMFGKVNIFLLKAPTWNLAKLPSYWIHNILNQPPRRPECAWKEKEWLLDLFIDGLQTLEDVNLYRRTGVFERVMLHCTSANAPRVCYDKMIDLLYRCCIVGGGSTLITRFGIWNWVTSQSNPSALLEAFKSKLSADLDNKHVRRYFGEDDALSEEGNDEILSDGSEMEA